MTDLLGDQNQLGDPVPAAAPAGTSRELRSRTGVLWARWSGLMILVLLIAMFSAWIPSVFDSSATVGSVLAGEPVTLAIAIAEMCTLIVGQFDLSVGYTLGISSVLMAWMVSNHHMPLYVGAVVALAVGGLIGAINAFLVLTVGINPFIATLGTGTIISGVILQVTGGNVLTNLPQSYLNAVSKLLGGLWPLGLFYVLAFCLLVYLVAEHTVLGRVAHSIGANAVAARLCGLPVTRFMGSAFVLGGVIAAAGGLLDLGRLGSAYPTIGPEFLLPAFAVCFLGRTMVKPGEFNVGGMLVASLLLSIGVTGLAEVGAPSWVTPVFDGAVLIVTVAAAVLRGGEQGAFHIG